MSIKTTNRFLYIFCNFKAPPLANISVRPFRHPGHSWHRWHHWHRWHRWQRWQHVRSKQLGAFVHVKPPSQRRRSMFVPVSSSCMFYLRTTHVNLSPFNVAFCISGSLSFKSPNFEALNRFSCSGRFELLHETVFVFKSRQKISVYFKNVKKGQPTL